MLDQYFIAKLKEVNTFFGQFALPFEHAAQRPKTTLAHPPRLAPSAFGSIAGTRHATL
jgi:hypothetical protein